MECALMECGGHAAAFRRAAMPPALPAAAWPRHMKAAAWPPHSKELLRHFCLDRASGIFTTRKRHEHRNLTSVLLVARAMLMDQIALFELNRDQDVCGRRHCEQKVRVRHRRRHPEC